MEIATAVAGARYRMCNGGYMTVRGNRRGGSEPTVGITVGYDGRLVRENVTKQTYTVPAPGNLRYVFAAVERRALWVAVTNQSVAGKPQH